jgi:hypothetical protein
VPCVIRSNALFSFAFSESIDLGNNNLMGTVPSEFGELTRLEFVSLNNNELVGSLPREVGLLTNMSKLFDVGYCDLKVMNVPI